MDLLVQSQGGHCRPLCQMAQQLCPLSSVNPLRQRSGYLVGGSLGSDHWVAPLLGPLCGYWRTTVRGSLIQEAKRQGAAIS